MPTSIFFSLKSQRNTTEKIAVRTISPKPAALLPTYDRRMKKLLRNSFVN